MRAPACTAHLHTMYLLARLAPFLPGACTFAACCTHILCLPTSFYSAFLARAHCTHTAHARLAPPARASHQRLPARTHCYFFCTHRTHALRLSPPYLSVWTRETGNRQQGKIQI